jgi:Secretion system C-terminal sorting domain
MKHIYILCISVLTITNLFAQRNSNFQVHTFDSGVNYPQTKFENGKAAGDVLFLFDGRFIGGKGVDSTTFNYKGEDLDSLIIDTSYTNYFFPSRASFVPTIDVKAPGDTNFYFIAVSYFKTPAKANDWISFGPIKIPAAGATLSWKHNFPNGDFRDAYKVHVNTVGIGAKNFTAPSPIYTITDNDATTANETVITPHVIFYPRSTSLSAYAGQSIYLGLQHDANDGDALSIDDVMITEDSFLQGIHENNFEESVIVYPNPSSGTFLVNFVSPTKRLVEVYTGVGELVYSNNFNTKTAALDLTNVNAGVYSMKVLSSDNKITFKQLVIIK